MPGIYATTTLVTTPLVVLVAVGALTAGIGIAMAFVRHAAFAVVGVLGLLVAGVSLATMYHDTDRELERITNDLAEHYDVTLDDVPLTLLRAPSVTTTTATPTDGGTPVPVTLVASDDRIVMLTTADMREWSPSTTTRP